MKTPMRVSLLAVAFFFSLFHGAAASTLVSGTISTDTTWTKANSPYVITNTLTISAGATLTIEPGVVVKMNPGFFVYILGTLNTGSATSSEAVTITSIKDDTVAGDTNGDGSTTAPAAGDWLTLYFLDGSHGNLKNAVMRYGGASNGPIMPLGLIQNQGGDVTIANSTLSDSTNYAVEMSSGTTTVTDSAMSRAIDAVHATGGSLTSTHNAFSNTRPIFMSSGSLDIGTNDFGTATPSLIDASVMFTNHAGNSGGRGFALSGTLKGNQQWVKDSAPYIINNTFTIPVGTSLSVGPGTVVKMDGNFFTYIYGTLNINGTSTDKVTITSIKDDTVAGDTNGDGSATAPAAGDWLTLYFLDGSTGNFNDVVVRYGGRSNGPTMPLGQIWNQGASVAIARSAFSDSANYHILQVSGVSSVTAVTDSSLTHAIAGIVSKGGTFTIHNSSIHDNTQYGVQVTQTTDIVDATNNFWGDASGPHHLPDNPFGQGNDVSDQVLFTPFLNYDPTLGGILNAPCTIECNSNVMFLPGIEASRLYRPDYNGGEDRLWEPNIDEDVSDLYLDERGRSLRDDIYTKVGAVLDELPNGQNIYKSFIGRMNDLKQKGTIKDWEPIAYDWRLSAQDILSNGNVIGDRIYYSGSLAATATPYILQELHRLASSSPTGKVTIIAHSNGGIIAKALLQSLGDKQSAVLIERLILVASPQVGTPAALAAAMHGYDQDHLFGLVTSKNTARTLASTSPMAYHLLPSPSYFTYVDDPVMSFSTTTLPDWVTRFGDVVHSQYRLNAFLSNPYGKTDSVTGDINSPIKLNSSLLTQADDLHASIDAWVPTSTIKVTEIAGWGIPTTVKGVSYKKISKMYCTQYGNCTPIGDVIEPDVQFTIDGDGTVVTPSALWTASSTNVEKWWLNLDDYNVFLLRNADHTSVLEITNLLNFLTDTIADQRNSKGYEYIQDTTPIFNRDRLRFSLHSPLSLDLYDSQGRHTGVSTSTGEVEQLIPNTYFSQVGDVKYIFTDASTSLTAIMRGYATSSFTFDVDQLRGDELLHSSEFRDLPTTPQTTATVAIGGDISTLSPLSVDQNSDGRPEYVITPTIDGWAGIPKNTTPPEIRLVFSTTLQKVVPTGIDASPTTATMSPLFASAIDTAGNTVSLGLTGYKEKKGRVSLNIVSLAYNGATKRIATSTIKYKWALDKKGGIAMFAAYLQNGSTTIEAHYRPKKNQTIVMQYPTDFNDSDIDDDCDTRPIRTKLAGLVVPWLETYEGVVMVKY